MPELGKMLVVVGMLLVAAGLVLWLGMGKGWLGRLPGDLQFESGRVRLYFPLVTCLLLSVLLTVLVWLWRR